MIKIISPAIEISEYDQQAIDSALRKTEWAGRTCYKSESALTDDTAKKFCKSKIKAGHLSIIEHVNITARITCNRGISHEIVRHRLGAYSQESTRYCNYGKSGIVFIKPCFFTHIPCGVFYNVQDIIKSSFNIMTPVEITWANSLFNSALSYENMLAQGCKPQEARDVLPNALKTEIVMTFNLREWRHVLSLRALGTAGIPHPQMVEIMQIILREFQRLIPVIFDNLSREADAVNLVNDLAEIDPMETEATSFIDYIQRAKTMVGEG